MGGVSHKAHKAAESHSPFFFSSVARRSFWSAVSFVFLSSLSLSSAFSFSTAAAASSIFSSSSMFSSSFRCSYKCSVYASKSKEVRMSNFLLQYSNN